MRNVWVLSLAVLALVAACETTSPSQSTLGSGTPIEVTSLSGVTAIQYNRRTHGEGGNSGTVIRQLKLDSNDDVWLWTGEDGTKAEYFWHMDAVGNLLSSQENDETPWVYTSSRGGSGLYATEAELASGVGTNWSTVQRSTRGENRATVRRINCTILSVSPHQIGSETFDAVRWRCINQRVDRSLPSVDEITAVRINGTLRHVDFKRCWTHKRASSTCDNAPGQYDGWRHVKATSIERG